MEMTKIDVNPDVYAIGYIAPNFILEIHGVSAKYIRIVFKNGTSYALIRHKTYGYDMSAASSDSLYKACGTRDGKEVLNYLRANEAYIAFYPLTEKMI